MCADCGGPNPEWASINLLMVICEACAGEEVFVEVFNCDTFKQEVCGTSCSDIDKKSVTEDSSQLRRKNKD